MPGDSVGRRIAAHRRRRGMSQAALAGLFGRSESWLSQVERGVRSVDRMSVLLDLSRLLHVEVQALTGVPWQLAPNGGSRAAGIDEIRGVPHQHTTLVGRRRPAPSPSGLRDDARTLHVAYQAARYSRVMSDLPDALDRADTALHLAQGQNADQTRSYVEVYVVASKLLTKVGVTDLGAVTADRAATAAGRTDSAVLQGIAIYQVVTALMRSDQVAAAEQLAVRMADRLTPSARPDDPDVTSVAGSLWLIGSVIAARNADRRQAEHRLDQAHALARVLGRDANQAWTAFGPTNVAIHRVSVAAEPGDPAGALDAAEQLDLDALPDGLSGRRAQVNLDLAWAHAQRRRDADATVNLLAAERIAPEALAHNVMAREVMREMLARARRGRDSELHRLAMRAGVLDP